MGKFWVKYPANPFDYNFENNLTVLIFDIWAKVLYYIQ